MKFETQVRVNEHTKIFNIFSVFLMKGKFRLPILSPKYPKIHNYVKWRYVTQIGQIFQKMFTSLIVLLGVNMKLLALFKPILLIIVYCIDIYGIYRRFWGVVWECDQYTMIWFRYRHQNWQKCVKRVETKSDIVWEW